MNWYIIGHWTLHFESYSSLVVVTPIHFLNIFAAYTHLNLYKSLAPEAITAHNRLVTYLLHYFMIVKKLLFALTILKMEHGDIIRKVFELRTNTFLCGTKKKVVLTITIVPCMTFVTQLEE